MNFAKTTLLSFLFGITLATGCNEAIIEEEVVLLLPQLSVIKVDSEDQTRYYYEDGQLVELQSLYNVYDQETDSTYSAISHYYFEYSNDKLIRVITDDKVINVSYDGSDLIVDNFHNQYPEATITFKNYNNLDEFRVEIFYQEGLTNLFKPLFDQNGNFLYAMDDNGNYIEDSYPGFYYLSPYYGKYSYNEMNSTKMNFDLEVQLALFHKPFYNCVKSVERNNKTILYNYDFDKDGFPTTSESVSIYPITASTSDTLFHETKEYFYGLVALFEGVKQVRILKFEYI